MFLHDIERGVAMVVPAGHPYGKLHWKSAALSDRGQRRRRNEDSLLYRPDIPLYAVADGMGGHAAGDVASGIAVNAVEAAVQQALTAGPAVRGNSESLHALLAAATLHANDELLRHVACNPGCAGMGTTLTILAPVEGAAQCVIAHIGDSRAYRLRDDELQQLTADHTWVQQQMDMGMLTPLQARHHPWSPLLNRVLGTADAAPPDMVVTDVRAGDTFLLCSDGLSGPVEAEDLHALLAAATVPATAVADLIAAANLRGGPDNISAVVLMVEQ